MEHPSRFIKIGWIGRRQYRVKWRNWVSIEMKKGKARNTNRDSVAEGVWLSAESMNHLLFNHLPGGKAMTETLWKCDQLRAGRLYNRMMFDTQAEALQFAQKMQQMEPDQTFNVEAIQASQVWN